MLKKMISSLLMFSVMNLAIVAFASDSTEKDARFAEKVKSEVSKLGTGPNAKIQVKLKDGRKLNGYVREVNDNQFVVVDSRGDALPVFYPNVKQVKHSNSRKIIIGAIIVGVIIIGVVLAARDQTNR